MDQLAAAVDIQDVPAGAGCGAQVHRATGDGDCRLIESSALLNDVTPQRQMAALDQDGWGIAAVDETSPFDGEIPGQKREGGRPTLPEPPIDLKLNPGGDGEGCLVHLNSWT